MKEILINVKNISKANYDFKFQFMEFDNKLKLVSVLNFFHFRASLG